MSTSRWTPCVTAVLLCSILLLSTTDIVALQVGDQAPDFSLPATTADKVSLADYLGQKHVVLFFDIAAFAGP